jgi:acyl carrier protein
VSTNDGLEGRVRAVIGRTFGLGPSDLAGELKMGAIPGWDSTGHMDLVVELEKEFAMTLATPRIAEIIDVPSICKTIRDEGRA